MVEKAAKKFGRNVRKRDLAVAVAKVLDMPQMAVLDVIQKTFEVIIEKLGEGQTIELRNFGVFEVAERKAHVARNPKKPGVEVKVPSHGVVRFHPGKEMRAATRGLGQEL